MTLHYKRPQTPPPIAARRFNEEADEDFIELCGEVLDLLDSLPPEAADFAKSCDWTVRRMRNTAMSMWENSGVAPTGRMWTALRNIAMGAEKWARR
jgi:hypothetical protein